MSLESTFLLDHRPAWVPIWREALLGVDWAALRIHPAYYGVGVPRGDGSAVITVPGFMGSDSYLVELRWWLRRIGYRPYSSQIGRNADCLNELVQRLCETLDVATSETGRKVHLVGHSLGGILARGAARLRHDQVASVTTMGSPFRGVRSHPMVLRMGDAVRERVRRERGDEVRPHCFSGQCDCPFVMASTLGVPEDIPELALYTKTDGVVAWRFCIHSDPTKNLEVKGTHCGLAWNGEAYRHLAQFLAA